MSHIAQEEAARPPSLAAIRGFTYTDPTQVFNRWLIPTYQRAFRWTGNRADSEQATADVFSSLLDRVALPAEVQLVNEQITDATLQALTRHWSDGYGVAMPQCTEIGAAEASGREHPPATLGALFVGLSAEMRLVLVLRFLRKRSLAAIGVQLRVGQDAARLTMISALTRVAVQIGLAPSWAGIGQEERVTAFVDDLVAGARPARFEADSRAWPAMVGATHVQAAIAGNDLPELRFVRLIEQRLDAGGERGRVTSPCTWFA